MKSRRCKPELEATKYIGEQSHFSVYLATGEMQFVRCPLLKPSSAGHNAILIGGLLLTNFVEFVEHANIDVGEDLVP